MDAGFTAFLREQEVSSFHPSLGTDCSAGGQCRGRVSRHCPRHCGQLQLLLLIPQITTQIQTLTSFLVLRLLCIGRMTTFHLLVRQQRSKSLHAASPRLIPDGFAVSLPIFAASEFLNSLKVCRRRISTLHIPSRASSVSKGVGKAPSLSLLLHKSSLPKQNPPTKLMVCLHRPNSQPGELEGSIPSKDHWYVGASSA